VEAAAAVAAITHCFPGISTAMMAAETRDTGLNTADELVTVQEIWFRYEKKQADTLKAVSLTIRRGEVVALMGTNGAGKTTLLQQINGLLQPDAGAVAVLGSPAAVGNGHVGQVLQNPDLMLFTSTVRDEILFGCRQASDFAMLLDSLGLNGLEGEFPLALSRGQRMRVAIAAVLACKPQVLLLDEPTTGQDAGRIEDIAGVLHTFASGGGAVLFCTHDTEMAAKIASRIIVMSDGRIVADGRPEEVFCQEAVLAEASLKLPPAVVIGQALVSRTTLTVEEVVSCVRQACLGAESPVVNHSPA
jgi:energy-coupling factor transport system ATP-binding protein